MMIPQGLVKYEAAGPSVALLPSPRLNVRRPCHQSHATPSMQMFDVIERH
jgi:hypothetical protein